MKLFHLVAFALATLALQYAFGNPSELQESIVASVQLGNTTVRIAHISSPPKEGYAELEHVVFINVHENENTSVIAAKALIYYRGGSLFFLQHHNATSRDIRFTLDGIIYAFDPNRMFTALGRQKTLSALGNYSVEAEKAVAALADEFLRVSNFTAKRVAVALHNNSPTYSAESYLPGHVFANDAKAVYINAGTNPRFFFYTTKAKYYDDLMHAKQNVVLQADNNSSLEDDGSLSVRAALDEVSYVNVEAAAEGGSEGDSILKQLNMLENLVGILVPKLEEETKIDWKLLGPLVGCGAVIVALVVTLIIQSIKLKGLKKPKKSHDSQVYEPLQHPN